MPKWERTYPTNPEQSQPFGVSPPQTYGTLPAKDFANAVMRYRLPDPSMMVVKVL
jgi:hypothetical protein